MSRPFKRDKYGICRQYPASPLYGRYSFHSLSLFLLSLLALVSACSVSGNIASTNAVSSPPIVSDTTHASITMVAATSEVVYLAGSDGSITARQASNGRVIWNQKGLAVLPAYSIYLVPAGQVLYDAYETTATTARVEARQISNGQVIWSQIIPHHLGPGYVVMIADTGMIYSIPSSHGIRACCMHYEPVMIRYAGSTHSWGSRWMHRFTRTMG